MLDGHPRIKELKAQIANLDQQIKLEAEGLARSFENDAKLANARVDSLMTSFDQLKTQAASTNEQDVELRALQRDAKAQRDLLESYMAKYREATALDNVGSSPADARVVSRATVSNVPSYPKKLPSVLIAAAATFMLCCGFVLTKELLSAPGAGVAAAAPTTQRRESIRAARGVRGRRQPAADALTEAIAATAQNLRETGPIQVLRCSVQWAA